MIDVSQSVEHDHPRALDFLRKDLQNITEFFRRKGVNVLGVRGLFDFVVDPSIEAGEAEEAALQGLNARAEAMTEEERSAEQIVQEEVFKNIHIPRPLDEVITSNDCYLASVMKFTFSPSGFKARDRNFQSQSQAGVASLPGCRWHHQNHQAWR